MPAINGPTLSEVERITAVSDPVVRNLQITQCYHELSATLGQRTGGGANWCSFATWASKQAGQTIRKEDLARTLEGALGSQTAVEQATRDLASAAQKVSARLGTGEIRKFIWKVLEPEAAFERSSQAVAGGNLKVFAEIGREFARFNADCLPDTTYDEGKMARWCEALRPGPAPEGQDALRQAFSNYYRALFEEDGKARHELLLFANLKIGYHEQTRLQPEINAALDAPILSPQMFARNLLQALRPEWGGLIQVVLYLLRLLGRLTEFDRASAAYLEAAQREAQRIVTETMMTIELPHGQRQRLGQDLASTFPPILAHLTNPDLIDLLTQIDPTPDSTLETGAQYWGDLPDRLHFIADMFRCFHISPDLFLAPFTEQQTAALKDGRLPAGRL